MKERSWKIAGIIGIITATAVIGYGLHRYFNTPITVENTSSISGKSIVTSPVSQAEIKAFIDKETRINGVGVVTTDLIKNTRRVTFFYADNADLQATWDEYLTRRSKKFNPVFANETPLYNERTANIINGGFDCRAFNTTLAFTLYPNAERSSPVVCALSIPPGFDQSGDFVGYLNFFMSGFPIDSEMKRLAADATKLATSIYNRDVKK